MPTAREISRHPPPPPARLPAELGVDVTGVDPAAAMLDVARSKPGADAVRWLHGDATTLPPLQVDAAFMTANVAQVFVTDVDWTATLDATRRAYERRTPELTRVTVDVPGVGLVASWEEVVDVAADLVTFRSTTAFEDVRGSTELPEGGGAEEGVWAGGVADGLVLFVEGGGWARSITEPAGGTISRKVPSRQTQTWVWPPVVLDR